jgi:hypothetical protein
VAGNSTIADMWQEYCDGFVEQSAYFKEPQNYTAVGKGDINTYKLFLERFYSLLSEGGCMGIVVPSGIYTDQGCQPLRQLFFGLSRIEFLYCFENRRAIFNIHRSFKFVLFGTQKGGETEEFKCAFMEHDPEKLIQIDCVALKLSRGQVERFSGDALSIPEFNSSYDVEIGLRILDGHPLYGELNVGVEDEIHKTNDSHLFSEKGRDTIPVYEGAHIWHYDNEFADVGLCINQADAQAYAEKELIAASRNRGFLKCRVGDAFSPRRNWSSEPRLAFREVAASTNERTFIFAFIPAGCLHTYSLRSIERFYLVGEDPNNIEEKEVWSFKSLMAVLAVCNSFVSDFYVRAQCTNHLSTVYMNMPISKAAIREPVSDFLVPRASRLSCTGEGLAVLWADLYDDRWQDVEFWYPKELGMADLYGPREEQECRRDIAEGVLALGSRWSPTCGVHGRAPDRRDSGDRAQLRAEIDACVAHVYGLSRDDFAYILDTFPVVKRKEERAFGEFMSRRKCLEEYDRLGPIIGEMK